MSPFVNICRRALACCQGLPPPDKFRLTRIGLAYFLAHQLAFLFPDSAGVLMAVWIAGGIGLATLLLNPRSLWPLLLGVMFAAGVGANLLSGRPFLASLGFMLANVAESAAGAWLITRLCGSRVTFGRVNEIVALILVATVINADTAFIGAGTAALTTSQSFWSFFKTWWIADGLGLLLVTPVIVLWCRKVPCGSMLSGRQKMESAWLILMAGGGAWLVFGVNPARLPLTPHPYMLCLVLVWMALRFEPRATATMLALIGAVAIGCTAAGRGSFPLGGHSGTEQLLMVQTFIGVVGIVILLLTTSQAERKASEDSLRRSENRFRSAMQNSPIGMGIVDAEGRWLEVNPALCYIFGYAPEELLAANLQQIAHPEDREGDAGYVADMLGRRTENYQTEKRYRHKDGHVVWGQLNVSLVRHPDGTPRHFVFQIQNITERKRHLCELIAGNTRYAQHEAALTSLTRSYVTEPGSLLQVLREIVAVVARALEVNRVSVWRYNADRSAIVCDTLFDASTNRPAPGLELRAETAPAYFQALGGSDVIAAHDVEQDARTAELTEAYLRPAGITSMLDVPIHSQGQAVGVLCCEHVGEKRQWKPDEQTFAIAVANLVSMQLAQVERLELEDQFRQAQKLEALGTLAGGIAHDFNNILAAILSFAELAKMDNPANNELQENLNQILKAGNRATSLVRQILWFSRQQKQMRRNLQLGPVLTEALGLIRATLPATIEIDHSISKPVPDVLADASQIHQVVMNLCANAGHAMQGKPGQLRVELDALRVDDSGPSTNLELRKGDYVRLTISDTGHGMEEATRKRIFEPFFTTKAPGDGTGLGLAVVHGIIKNHDGVIMVQSTPGRGSCFTILLPAVPAVVPTDHRECRLIPKGHGQRILFVDDEPDLCEAASRMINRLGYVPVVFNSSEAAWKAIQTQPDDYDLMVSDLTMPVLTGTDLARNVLGLRPTFPIVLTSGYTEGLSEGFIRELGIRELVLKPLDFQSLAQAINRALRDPPHSAPRI
jgi:PAS domain S-box-containing protein